MIFINTKFLKKIVLVLIILLKKMIHWARRIFISGSFLFLHDDFERRARTPVEFNRTL